MGCLCWLVVRGFWLGRWRGRRNLRPSSAGPQSQQHRRGEQGRQAQPCIILIVLLRLILTCSELARPLMRSAQFLVACLMHSARIAWFLLLLRLMWLQLLLLACSGRLLGAVMLFWIYMRGLSWALPLHGASSVSTLLLLSISPFSTESPLP